MKTCVFCRIIRGELPSTTVYEDDELIAIRDIQPQAPTHILVIPKRHIPSLMSAEEGDVEILGKLLYRARLIAEDEGLKAKGARFIINHGKHGGQTVDHLHLHVVGGKQLSLTLS